LKRATSLYARYGVQQLWVIDAKTRRTVVHEAPTPSGWSRVAQREPGEMLGFGAVPGFSIRLADI
jgi:Uma2 family endonuclease